MKAFEKTCRSFRGLLTHAFSIRKNAANVKAEKDREIIQESDSFTHANVRTLVIGAENLQLAGLFSFAVK